MLQCVSPSFLTAAKLQQCQAPRSKQHNSRLRIAGYLRLGTNKLADLATNWFPSRKLFKAYWGSSPGRTEDSSSQSKRKWCELPQQDSRRKKRRQNNLPVSLNLSEFSDSLLRAVESTMDRRAAIFLTIRVEEPLELMGVSQISILPTDMFASCRWNASILKTPRPNTVHGTRRTNSETRESRKSWEVCGLLNPDPKTYVLHLQIDSFGRIMAARKHTIFCLLSILWAILLRGLKVVTAPSWLVRCALLPQEDPCSASLHGYIIYSSILIWYLFRHIWAQ